MSTENWDAIIWSVEQMYKIFEHWDPRIAYPYLSAYMSLEKWEKHCSEYEKQKAEFRRRLDEFKKLEDKVK